MYLGPRCRRSRRCRSTRHTVAAPGEGIALGRQFSVTDLNGDSRPDILAPTKHSYWVLFNKGHAD